MRLNIKIIFLLPLLILILSCGNTPKSTAEKMKQEACKGDVAGFFSHIDKDQVAENFKKQALAEMKPAQDELEALGQDLGQALADKIIPAMMEQIWKAMEAEVKKGAESRFCKMKIITAKGPDQVITETSDGKQLIWQFTKRADKWIVTSFPNEAKKPATQ